MFPRLPRLRFQGLFDWISLGCAIALAVATLGIPLPHPLVKSVGEWFPCLDCACGCSNAEVCWRDCCCYSTAEKIALAAEQGVEPPRFLLERFSEEAAGLNPPDLAELKPCCRARALAAWKARENVAAVACQSPVNRPARSSVGSNSKTKSSEPTSRISISPQKCQGLSMSLVVLPSSVLDGTSLGLQARPPLVGRWEIRRDLFPSSTLEPPTPPPRRVG